MKAKINFNKFIKMWGVIFIISLALLLLSIEAVISFTNYKSRVEKTREQFITQQKSIIKQEVEQAIDLINYRIYNSNFEKDIIEDDVVERRLLEIISRIRFGKEGYIFVNRLNGDALVSNGKILSGTEKLWDAFNSNKGKMKELFQMEYDAAIKPDGDFIYYSFIKLSNSNTESPKVSFVYGISSLQWLIGAGVYLDDIEEEISLIKGELFDSFIIKLLYTIIIISVAIALLLFLLNVLLSKLKNDLNKFFLFFKKYSFQNEPIDLTEIKFVELVEMAKCANKMLQDKIYAQQNLLDERELLLVTIQSIGDALITTDKSGKIKLMNPVAEKLTGWSLLEAKDKYLIEVFNIVNAQTGEEVNNPVNKVLESGEIVGLANHTKLISKDGTEHQIADSASPIRNSAGDILGVVLVFRDVTVQYEIQNKLRESEEQFRKTFEISPDSITISSMADGKYVDVNKGFIEITGYSREEIIGKTSSDINVWNNIDERDALLKKLVNKEKVNNVEAKFRMKNGSIITALISATIMELNSENVILFVARDITDMKKAEHALKLSEARYSRIANLTYEGILIHKNGIVIDVNKALEKISGYSYEELVGKDIIKLLVVEKYQDMLIENMKSNYVKPSEIEGIRKDGAIIQIEMESQEIEYDNHEENIRVTAIRDITIKKKHEFEILKLSNAMEQSPVSIVIINIDGNIEYVNPKFSQITGYSFDEAINQDLRVLISDEQPDEFYKELWETISDGNEWKGEFINKKRNGEIFWERAVISPIKDSDGKIVHYMAIKEDITEYKKMLSELMKSKEKAENADKMKSIFLAQMSHEIRTPINSLISTSTLIRYDFEDTADKDQMMSFDIIDRAGNRIIRTIDLLLNLSEVQAGIYEPEKTNINLYSDILAPLVTKNRKIANSSKIKLNLTSSTKEVELVTDLYTVTQIFTQLIENAMIYTKEGGVTVKIFRNELDQLAVEVIDTGIGIAEEYLPQIFEAFSQEEMGYTRSYDGNGLGLTLVKTYCELNNATIKIESEKGVGSTFRVTFNPAERDRS